MPHRPIRPSLVGYAGGLLGIGKRGLIWSIAGADDPPDPEPGKTFTQDELTAISTREHDQGKRQGAREAAEKIAEELGVPLEEAKQIITSHRERSEAEMSEAQRLAKAAADREAAAEARERAAIARERAANVRAALVTAGAAGDDVADAALLVQVGDDADETAISEAVGKLKERRPELFKGTPTPPPGSDPGGRTPKPPVKPGEFGREGITEFERRFPQKQTV